LRNIQYTISRERVEKEKTGPRKDEKGFKKIRVPEKGCLRKVQKGPEAGWERTKEKYLPIKYCANIYIHI
jgi:hypothetical protein